LADEEMVHPCWKQREEGERSSLSGKFRPAWMA